jgi:hypothetical protein
MLIQNRIRRVRLEIPITEFHDDGLLVRRVNDGA